MAIDTIPTTGLRFLEEFGPFDEVSSGGGWANSMALALIRGDFPGQVAIPQLLVVERSIVLEDPHSSAVEDRLLGRKIGSEQIVSFANVLVDS